MKNVGHKLCLNILVVVLFWAWASVYVQARTNNSPATLCVMSYNLRFASLSGPNAWPDRRPVMRELIRRVDPDVIGTQEGIYAQLRELGMDLPEYDWIGLGREGGSRGEFTAVFYRRARLEPIEFDYFWLSDTPDCVGSTSWGNKLPRMVTWVRFRDRKTQSEFYFWNTHLDHQSAVAREKSALLIRQRVAGFDRRVPLLLVGDFNAAAGASAPFEILTAENFFVDAWQVAHERRGEGVGTFNNFRGVPIGGARIDWILVRGNIIVDSVEIVTNRYNGRFASDHYPVVAHVRFMTGN